MDPEKKKLIVVGSLFVAMLGIGAFQFTKGGGAETPAPVAEAKKDDESGEKKGKGKGDKPEAAKNPLYAAELTTRDPFQPAAFSVSNPTPAAPVNPSASPVGTTPAMPPRLGGGPVPTLPDAMTGELPPMMPGGASTTTIPPVSPPKPRFRGTLAGVVIGTRSAAVFRMPDGDRIVPVGTEIEPGVRLVSVGSRRAVVRFHEATITLTLRDEPFAASASSTPAAPKAAPASQTSRSSAAPVTTPTPPNTGSETDHD